MQQIEVKEMPKDKMGALYEAQVRDFEARMQSEPRKVYAVVADGYAFAIWADDTYLVHESYRGTDGVNYDRLREANEFETHLLRKIESLNKFFVFC